MRVEYAKIFALAFMRREPARGDALTEVSPT